MAISTNRQYLLAQLSKFGLSEDETDLILVENTLSGDGAVNALACKQAMQKSLSILIPVVEVSESGYSQRTNVEALKIWYNALCNELGVTNNLTKKPTIRNRSNLW